MGLHIMHALPWLVSLVALFVCAASDLKCRIIPNRWVVLIAMCGLALSLALRPELVWISLPAAVLTLVGFGVLAHFDLIGGGDVKLISAVTLLVPPAQIGALLILIALAGGVLGCLYIAARYRLRMIATPQADRPGLDRQVGRLQRLVEREGIRIASGEPMPYALAVFGGLVSYIARELPHCFSATSCSV
jgi:prepilin peptidase CpaA